MNFKKFVLGTTIMEASSGAENWLKNYTLEGMDKYPSSARFNELVEEYPYEGGTLYRGLNFSSKEQYEDFLEKTSGGTKLETGSISSWTPSAGQANQFAVTRPTYFLSHDLMQAESLKNKNVDYMIGHAGLILKITVPADVGLDVRKTPHVKESEVILPPGTYDITIHKTLLPFVSSISDKNFKQEFMSIASLSDTKENSLDVKKFEHIMYHYKDFDDEMKRHLFKLISKNIDDIKYAVDINEDGDYWGASASQGKLPTIKSIYIGFNVSPALIAYYNILLPEDKNKARKKIDEVVKKLDAEFVKKTSDIDWASQKIRIDMNNSVTLAIKMGIINPSFYEEIKRGTGKRYNTLNSYERMKEINKLTGRAQEEAIRRFTKDIELALKNLA